eukprot:TRINITY_DN11447_c0_g1_i1.p1 TRINITY_DN11447_c0_g1~~TRINITY_DN11447_c0_g1_i1.p1  ORF type:complete len:277 (+),score=10.45 TRINITY_DN11447_c0_g1_i1:49-831(+)
MAERLDVSQLQSRVWSLMDACNRSYIRVVGATFDILAVLCVVSMMFKVRHMDLTLPAVHLALAYIRSIFVIVCNMYPHWLTSGRKQAILLCSALSSAAVFIGCATAAIVVERAYSLLDVLPEPTREDYDVMYMKGLALMSYSVLSAILSFITWICMMRNRPRAPSHNSERAPTDLLILKDLILRVFVLDDHASTADPLYEMGDGTTCCICLSAMLPGELVSELVCRHRYHTSCLEGWEASQRKHRRSTLCPMRCDMRSTI